MGNWDYGFSWIDEVARAFDELTHDSRSAYSQNFPPMDSLLDEDTGELTLEFALAGWQPEELDVTVSGDTLRLKGQKQAEEDKSSKQRILRQGIKARDFEVRYQLPAGRFDAEATTVSYKHGVLAIVFKPSATRQPKKLQITTGE